MSRAAICKAARIFSLVLNFEVEISDRIIAIVNRNHNGVKLLVEHKYTMKHAKYDVQNTSHQDHMNGRIRGESQSRSDCLALSMVNRTMNYSQPTQILYVLHETHKLRRAKNLRGTAYEWSSRNRNQKVIANVLCAMVNKKKELWFQHLHTPLHIASVPLASLLP